MTKRFIIALVMSLPLMVLAQWTDDTLGYGYEMRYVDQGADYSGPVRSTVVRKRAECGSDVGVLYVHGYNDYFFQREMGDRFVDSCYNFYAVDLRKYGRSIMPGQTKFEVRDLREYYADLDSALAIMKADGIKHVALMAHSTGGLITSMYMNESPDTVIDAMVLNSPFLEWNLNAFQRKFLIPAVVTVTPLMRNLRISNGNSTAYAESLLNDYHGEWEYNTDWKTVHPEKVSTSWLTAIDRGHATVQNDSHIRVPLLLMHSDNSVNGDKWTPGHMRGDAVLNVNDISKYGRQLGFNVTEYTAPGGMHDLILSTEPVREGVYDAMFGFLRRQGLSPR